MRKKIKDDEGMIGPKGSEIDLYRWIKSYAEEEDVERFNDKVELAKKRLKSVNKAIITLEKHPVRFCEQMEVG